MNKLELHINGSGQNSFLRNIPQTVENITFSDSQPVRVTPPAGAQTVFFSCTSDYWVSATGTDQNGAELNPIGYQLGAEVLNITSEQGAKMSIAFYS